MDVDLVLAIAHHLTVLTLVGIIAAEFALLQPGISGTRLSQLARMDAAYGGVAALVLLAGFARVFWGAKGADYYLGNNVFWGKMGLFLLVGLLSIRPTMAFRRWSYALTQDSAYAPGEIEIAASRRFIHLQVAVLVFIPIFAAAMARGYGLS